MRKKILFIVNPISGIGRQKVVERLIDKVLDKDKFSAEIRHTEGPKHATELSSEAAESFDLIVAVGGDGSVNEVGRGLVNTGTAMAILPAGSGNGLARYLGMPLKLSRAIEVINNFKIREIDTISINNEVFLNMAGIGFDAHIAHLFSQHGKRGFVSYLRIILKEFRKYKGISFEIDVNDGKHERSVLLASFANSTQWGNNGHIAPLAEIDDGLIDISLVQKFSLWESPAFAFRLLNKTAHNSKLIETIKTGEFRIRSEEDIIAHFDGEPITFGKELNIKVNPLSLKMIVP